MRSIRRTLFVLAILLFAPQARAESIDVLLIGDSLAYQMAPHLVKVAKEKQVTLRVVAYGGSSVVQWIRKGWVRGALKRWTPRQVWISLGTNCTLSERKKIREDIVKLVMQVDASVLWLVPPKLYFSTAYLTDALRDLELPVFSIGKLPMGWDKKHNRDDVHPTAEGYRSWARALGEAFW